MRQFHVELRRLFGDDRRFDTVLRPEEFPQWRVLFEDRARTAFQRVKGDIEIASWATAAP